MEKWHGDQVHRVGIEAPHLTGDRHHAEEVVVGELDALGKAGRARGVELVTRVLGCRWRHGIDGRLAGDPVFVGHIGVGRAENDDSGITLQIHLGEMIEKLVANEQHLDLRVIQDVCHLRRCEPPVHRNGDGIYLCCTKQHGEVLGHVLVQERDPVLVSDTRVQHRLCHLVGLVMELLVGARVVVLQQGNLVGTLLGVDPNQFTNSR